MELPIPKGTLSLDDVFVPVLRVILVLAGGLSFLAAVALAVAAFFAVDFLDGAFLVSPFLAAGFGSALTLASGGATPFGNSLPRETPPPDFALNEELLALVVDFGVVPVVVDLPPSFNVMRGFLGGG